MKCEVRCLRWYRNLLVLRCWCGNLCDYCVVLHFLLLKVIVVFLSARTNWRVYNLCWSHLFDSILNGWVVQCLQWNPVLTRVIGSFLLELKSSVYTKCRIYLFSTQRLNSKRLMINFYTILLSKFIKISVLVF